MGMMGKLTGVLTLATGLVLAVGAARAEAPAVDAPTVGHAEVVVKQVSGELGPVKREIFIDDDVMAQEIIATGPDSATKLIFRDGTEFVIGAESRVTLDRFVYDPETATGRLVMTMISGAFEFATGLMEPQSYEIRTPFATLAIRG